MTGQSITIDQWLGSESITLSVNRPSAAMYAPGPVVSIDRADGSRESYLASELLNALTNLLDGQVPA